MSVSESKSEYPELDEGLYPGYGRHVASRNGAKKIQQEVHIYVDILPCFLLKPLHMLLPA